MKTTICLDSRFAKHPSIVSRKIVDEFILVPVRQNVADLESIYTMNDVATRIWELLDGERRVEEIKNALVEEFEVSPEEAEVDLVQFLQQLEKVGAVQRV